MLNLKRESLVKWWQGTAYWFTNLLSDWLFIYVIYFGADLVGQGVEERVEIRFQLFFSFPWLQIFEVKTYEIDELPQSQLYQSCSRAVMGTFFLDVWQNKR